MPVSCRMRPAGRSTGVTLVELLVALAVVAILLTVAVPGFRSMWREIQASQLIDAYVHALRIARSEAVSRRIPTAVCQSDQLGQCTRNGDWATGWLVFQDLDADGDCASAGDGVCADGGRVLIAHRPNLAGFDFLPNGNPEESGYVSYGPSGFAIGQNSTFSLCDRQGGAAPRAVVLSLMGRVRVGGAEDAHCAD